MSFNLRLLARYPVLTLAVTAIVLVLVLNLLKFNDLAKWIGIATVIFVICITAYDMIKAILKRNFGLDILALVAMVATLLVGEYLAALIIVLMLTGGEALEDYAQRKASSELTSLLGRSPQTAHLVVGNNELKDISVEEVKIGDELVVKPAEVVPVDAVLLSDEAIFDESSITGESLPVTKTSGDNIYSGILNGSSAVRIRATKLSADSQFQQIIKLVQQAETAKAPVVRIADRFALPFTAVSLLIAGLAWAISGDPLRFAQVLVLATPCPLLIAAPVAFLGGMSRAAKLGVVVKGGSVLETLARVDSVAFDKTGTLTKGEPELQRIDVAAGFAAAEVLLYAASAEQYSSHVLAEGICDAAKNQGIKLLTASAAQEQATNGVSATISDREVIVGKFSFIKSFATDAKEVNLEFGETAAYVSIDGKFAGALILADHVRAGSKPLIDWLKQNGIKTIAMVTGDAHQTANSVATNLDIGLVHAELLPQDKVELVAKMGPKPTLMVGDGVNDAPVLAAADVGIAMAARGSTAAGEAADAVILKDSISKVGDAIHISRHTLKIALQAIWIGIIMSIGLMLIAATGVIPAVVGAFMQEIVDLVAILYALRTLSVKPLNLRVPVAENSELVTSH